MRRNDELLLLAVSICRQHPSFARTSDAAIRCDENKVNGVYIKQLGLCAALRYEQNLNIKRAAFRPLAGSFS